MASTNTKKVSTNSKSKNTSTKVTPKKKPNSIKKKTSSSIKSKVKKKSTKKVNKNSIILLLLAFIALVVLISGAAYAYYKSVAMSDSSTKTVTGTIPEAANVSLTNPVKNLHIRLNALNMQEKDAVKELWATDTSEDYEDEETPREVTKVELIGGTDETNYSCTFKLNIELTGTMAEVLEPGDAVIKFSGLSTFEYDLTEIVSPRIIVVNNLNINDREKKLYVTAKINNKSTNQDYLQGKSLGINITNSDLACVIGN